MNKQTHPQHGEAIQTDGCYFMVDLSIGEDIGYRLGRISRGFTPLEVNLAYHYAIPDFMEDHRQPGESRCYILDHPAIISIGLYIMGFREHSVEYKYRNDAGIQIIGRPDDLDDCNYFVKEVLIGNGPRTHFIRCDRRGVTLYNPGITDDMEWESFRGYKVTAR